MATRETIKTLRDLVDDLNMLVSGTAEVWTRDERGNNTPRVDAYVLDAAYGGYRLCRIVSGGGERDITGRDTARVTAASIRLLMYGVTS